MDRNFLTRKSKTHPALGHKLYPFFLDEESIKEIKSVNKLQEIQLDPILNPNSLDPNGYRDRVKQWI